MKQIFLLLLGVLLFTYSQGQNLKVQLDPSKKVASSPIKSAEFKAEFLGLIQPASVDTRLLPILSSKCIKQYKQHDELLQQIKDQKMIEKLAASYKDNAESENTSGNAIDPVVLRNFQGNGNNGYTPLDNTMAISNGGKIISAVNTTIEFYNESGTKTFTNTIESFFNDAGITVVCDPVVIYDSGSDRFIFFAQECSGNSGNTNLLICFSQSNDPNGTWARYKLTGDPAVRNLWFDYPKMAVSNNELYITGNLFTNAGNFSKAVLYQIEKNAGFSGGTINWQYWIDIDGNPFTLLPLSWGRQGNYGPGCFLVATSASGSSNIQLYELTDDMSSSTEQLNLYNVSTTAYSPAADGQQSGTTVQLDNGDCRALSGFYLDGIVHFVFHSDRGSGFNALNYNRIQLSSVTNQSKIFGANSFEYSYPSVASSGNSVDNKSVIIGFCRSGSSIFPEIRAVNVDDDMRFSNSVLVKAGLGFAAYTSTTKERWGDYSGICKRYNSTNPTVWMSAAYGSAANDWSAYIAEIGGNELTSIPAEAKSSSGKVFPNPTLDQYHVSFTLETDCYIEAKIISLEGKVIEKLYSGRQGAGEKLLSFNKAALNSGVYFVSVHSNSKSILHEKLVIGN